MLPAHALIGIESNAHVIQFSNWTLRSEHAEDLCWGEHSSCFGNKIDDILKNAPFGSLWCQKGTWSTLPRCPKCARPPERNHIKNKPYCKTWNGVIDREVEGMEIVWPFIQMAWKICRDHFKMSYDCSLKMYSNGAYYHLKYTKKISQREEVARVIQNLKRHNYRTFRRGKACRERTVNRGTTVAFVGDGIWGCSVSNIPGM